MSPNERLINWSPPEVSLPQGDVAHPSDSSVKVTRDKKGWHFVIPAGKGLQVTQLVHDLLPGVQVPKVTVKEKKSTAVTIPLDEGDQSYRIARAVTFAAAVSNTEGPARASLNHAYDEVGRTIAKRMMALVFGDDGKAKPAPKGDGKTKQPAPKGPYDNFKGSDIVTIVVEEAGKHGIPGAEFAILLACVISQIRYPIGAVKEIAQQAQADAAAAKADAAAAKAKVGELEGRLTALADHLASLSSSSSISDELRNASSDEADSSPGILDGFSATNGNNGDGSSADETPEAAGSSPVTPADNGAVEGTGTVDPARASSLGAPLVEDPEDSGGIPLLVEGDDKK